MNVDDARNSFREEQDRRSRDRQLVLLGALFASEGMRARVDGKTFADAALQDAALEMLGGGSAGKWGLKTFANSIGLAEWEPTKNGAATFLALLLKHCRADAEVRDLLTNVVRCFERVERTAHGSLAEKLDAAARAKRLIEEAYAAVSPTPLEEAEAEPAPVPRNGSGHSSLPRKGTERC